VIVLGIEKVAEATKGVIVTGATRDVMIVLGIEKVAEATKGVIVTGVTKGGMIIGVTMTDAGDSEVLQ